MPVYETYEGWMQDLARCRSIEELPHGGAALRGRDRATGRGPDLAHQRRPRADSDDRRQWRFSGCGRRRGRCAMKVLVVGAGARRARAVLEIRCRG